MNQLVKFYRESDPQFQGSDDEILELFEQKYPQLIPQFPDALADYNLLKQRRQQAINEAFPPSAGERLTQAGGSFIRGATGTAGSALVGLSSAGTALERATIGPTPPVEENLTYRLGRGLQRIGEQAVERDPRTEGNFLEETLPSALGSAATFIAGGLATGGSRAAVAGLGALAGSGAGFEDARASGASEEDAQLSSLLNGIVGTSEAIPLSRILTRLNGVSGNTLLPSVLNGFAGKLTQKFGGTATQVGANALRETFEESLQEAFQGVAGNTIASQIVQYDPEREILQGVGEQAAAGGVTGLLLSLVSSAVGSRRGATAKAGEQPAPEIQKDTAVRPEPKTTDFSADLEQYVGTPTPERRMQLEDLARRDLAGQLSLVEQEAIKNLAPNDRNLYVLIHSELASMPPDSATPDEIVAAEEQTAAAPVLQAEADQPQSVASVPVMITRRMERDLLDLGYSQEQINSLTPQQANDILIQGIRPAQEPAQATPVEQAEDLTAGGLESQVQTEQAEPGPSAVETINLPQIDSSLIESPAQVETPALSAAPSLEIRPVAGASIPLGVNRPWVEDRSLRVLTESEFSKLRRETAKRLDDAEARWDNDQITPEELAPLQDAYAAVELERFRRNIEGAVPEDLFFKLRQISSSATKFGVGSERFEQSRLILEELKRQGATKEEIVGQVPRFRTSSEAESYAGEVRDIEGLIRSVYGEQPGATPAAARTRPSPEEIGPDTQSSIAAPEPSRPNPAEFEEYIGLLNQETQAQDALETLDRLITERSAAASPEDIAQANAARQGLVDTIGQLQSRATRTSVPQSVSSSDLLEMAGLGFREDIAGRQAQLMRLQRGVGTKGAPSFIRSDSWEDVFQDVTSEKGTSASRKVAILQAPNGNVVAASVANMPLRGKRTNVIRTPFGNKTVEQMSDLGYRPLAALKLRFPVKRIWSVYSPADGQSMIDEAENRIEGDVEIATAVEESIEGQTETPDETVANAEQDAVVLREAFTLASQPVFSADDAQAAYNLYADAIKSGQSVSRASYEVANHEALESSLMRLRVRLIETGEFSTPEQVNDAALDVLAESLEDTYGKHKDRAGFIQLLQARNFGEASQSPTAQQANQTVAGEAVAREVAPEVRFRQLHYGRDGSTIPTANTAFKRSLAAAYRAGWSVELYQRTANTAFNSFFQREGGSIAYTPKKTLIALSMNNAMQPNAEDARTLMHELAHGMADTLFPVDIKPQILAGIDAFTDAQLGIENSRAVTAGNPNERLAEFIAQQGVDQRVSANVANRIIAYFLELMARAALTVQRMLRMPVSPTLASNYTLLRTRRLLNGDSVLAYLGGTEMDMIAKAKVFMPGAGDNWAGINAVYNSDTGRMEPEVVLPETSPQATFNIKSVARFRDIDERTLSPDKNNLDAVAQSIVPANELLAVLQDMHRQLPAGISFDDFIQQQINRGIIKEDPRSVVQTAVVEAAASNIEADPNQRASSIASDMTRRKVQRDSVQVLYNVESRLRSKVMDANQELSGARGSIQDRLYRNASRLNTLINQKENQEVLLADVRNTVNGEMARLKSFIKRLKSGPLGLRGAAVQREILRGQSRLAGYFEELNGSPIDQALIDQYTASAEQLVKNMESPSFQDRLVVLLRTLAQSGISLNQSPRQVVDQIRALNNPLFEEFIRDTPDSRGRMAVLLTLSESPVTDILAINASRAFEERRKIGQLLKLAISGREQDINAAMAEAQRMPELGIRLGRVLNEIQRVERKQRALRDRLISQQNLVEFATTVAIPAIKAARAPFEQALGIGTQSYWNAVSGATIRPPESMQRTNQDLFNRLREFTFKAGRDSAQQAELQGIIRDLGKWLDSVPAEQRNYEWNDMAVIRDKLIRADGMERNEAVASSRIVRILGSKADQMDQTGNPDARRASRRMRDIATWLHVWKSDWEVQGTKWSAAEGEAMKALGFSGKQKGVFRDLFYNRVLKFIEDRSDLSAAYGEKRGFDEAVDAVRSWLSQDPEAARYVQTQQAWGRLERYIRATVEANATMLKWNQQSGLKVRETFDNPEGGNVFRNVLGESSFEIPRTIRQEVFNLHDRMRSSGWVDFIGLSNKEIEAMMDGGQLEATLNNLITPDIWANFIGEMAQNPAESMFNAPRTDGPVWKRASVAGTKDAFERSRNINEFIQNLFEIESGGQPADQREFVLETLDTIRSLFRRLHAVAQERESVKNQTPAELGELMMNARISNGFPAGFVEYRTFETHSMRAAAQQMAFNAALGYEKSGWNADLDAADRFFRGKEDELAQLQKQAKRMGGDFSKNLKSLAETAGGKGYLTYLQNATRNRGIVSSTGKFLNAYIADEAKLNQDVRPFAEMINAGVAHVLQGPASALTDTISVFNPLLHSGPSWGSISYVGQTARATINEFIRPYLQIVGLGGKWDADFQGRKAALGIVDSDTQVKAKEILRAIYTDTQGTPGFFSRNLARLARITRSIPSMGVGNLVDGDNTYQTAKGVWGVFTQMGIALRTGAAYGTIKTYEDAVARGVEFFQNSARSEQLNDPAYKLKAEDIGYTDRLLGIKTGDNFFRQITGKLEQYGTSIEGLAKDYIRRRSIDPEAPLLTDDMFRRLMFLGANEISMDSSLANRAPIFVTDTSWRLAMPLLGWSVEQAATLGKNFREVGGAQSKRAMYKGLLGMASILPIAFAYALLRDEYDEEILGKKADRKNIFETDGSPEAIGLATVDMLARVGTFGIIGDVTNSLINFAGEMDNRGLSLDNRVYFVNSLMGAGRAFAKWAGQDFNGTYATVGRPMAQALGGSGYLQWLQIVNNLTGADNFESRVTTRINAQNYLRAAGRTLKLDVRTGAGAAGSPTPLKPFITEMALAAYSNDPQGFQEAYRQAKAIAQDMGSEDPDETVQRSYQASHPLRTVFRTTPSAAEFQRLIQVMDPTGQRAVAEAVRLFNFYGSQIGVTPNIGKREERRRRRNPNDLLNAGMRGLGPTRL